MSGIITQPGRHLAELPVGDLVVFAAGGRAMLAGFGNVYLTANARWDGSQWLRYDTAAPAAALVVNTAGTVEYRTTPAGANPITWATAVDSGWIGVASPSLYNPNWSDFDASHPVQYRKDATGRVWLRGLAKKGVALVLPDTILFLPAGYRPTRIDNPMVAANAAGVYTEVRVQTTGAVQLQSGGSAVWTGLDNLSFDTG